MMYQDTGGGGTTSQQILHNIASGVGKDYVKAYLVTKQHANMSH